MSRILIVDDEAKITRILSDQLGGAGFDTTACLNAEDALEIISKGDVDIVLCDLRLPGMDGLQLLRETRKNSPSTDFVMMTAYASADTAVEAMREGAYEYLIKPFHMDEVILLLKRITERRDLMIENVALKEKISVPGSAGRIIGSSPVMKKLRELIAMVAPTESPVLVQGESGTGKELVAAEIHNLSKRSGRPFIVINCAAIPETLIESELFGHEKGSFTGAVQKRPGQFKLADGGTLFLDEIGEMPPALQAKLLRAIENGEFLPVGGSSPVKVDVRIVAATNRDLEELSSSGSFRSDLLYRLNVFPISLPPLRERRQDIVEIAEDFLSGRSSYPVVLSDGVVEKLQAYSWPGNVRELRNILERASILAGGGEIAPEHVMTGDPGTKGSPEELLGSLVGEMSLTDMEKCLITLAIERAEGNKSSAAKMLGITRRTLYSRMDKYGMTDGTPDEE
ncbi:MAG TPA: sigma-54 dependent transcriptional regulator [Candidatus Krumholzibacterium sp.]|nr:sigma-54 dependent transcriptional regulator [Candidatus Krumholzibacterium sp.]